MKVTTTKIKAAQCQLREAIRLWFTDGDLASMHVLAYSAHQIVADINAARGGRDLLYDTLNIKDEYRKKWIKIIKDSYNQLKHADKSPDPDYKIMLDTDLSELFILFTCFGLELLKAPPGKPERAFAIYFLVLHPELIRDGKQPFKGIPEASIVAARTVPKSTFWSAFLRTNAKENRG
jgi:hypothetical protein